MKLLDAKNFAQRIRNSYPNLKTCKIRYADSNGCLVLEVTNDDGDLIAMWDTGLDGHHSITGYLLNVQSKLETELQNLNFTIGRN